MENTCMQPQAGGIITERYLEWYHHTSLPSWGYAEEQTDTFAVLHPKNEEKGKVYPLYVVFHSAGHDVYSAVGCTWAKGNHDIYHAPDDMYALYLDCRQHKDDWWWGGNSQDLFEDKRSGTQQQPVENRCMATVEWVLQQYPIDRERVYAVGNSMGGSGALGVAMCRGDVFAAIKANVPAGVRHVADRCCLDTPCPDGFRIPDPPVVVDYSAQNDAWSEGHEILYRGMREKKYALLGFWGNFGHANNNEAIAQVNDLIHAFDIALVRRNAVYPAFTEADTDDEIPWNGDGTIGHDRAGQVNAFFRWGEAEESASSVSIPLWLLTEDAWKSRVAFPEKATANVTLRRLQKCRFISGTKVRWSFGEQSGIVCADRDGLVTVPGVTVQRTPCVLTLQAESMD